ncbi:hypothetical protein [Acinetobacter bouvetii]|uniref:hypothetical protein n=1 Tax=Acinetobacter bouvetii TaxID=202951 RepID=UPI0003803E3D|nr:hypothetical protein [Acinetobacter bouvetii]
MPERQLVFLTAIQLKIAGSVFSIFSSAIENCRFIYAKTAKGIAKLGHKVNLSF